MHSNAWHNTYVPTYEWHIEWRDDGMWYLNEMAKAWRSVKKVKEYQNELLRWLTYTDDAHAGGPISPPHIGEYRAKQCSLKAAFAREQWHREWYEYGKSLRSNEHAAEFPELPPR